MEFKVGDIVRRTSDEFNGMYTGDIATVALASCWVVDLKEFGEGHDPDNLELYSKEAEIDKWLKENPDD